ncbi:MAG: c-type cytochrome [Georgfuchsia sp.]
MKSILVSLTAASCMLIAGAAQADQALATAKGCMACHDIATKKLGPAYKDVAKKYAGQKDAEAKLVKKVLEGGSGVWGPIPMPSNKAMGVTEADTKKLVEWILGLK